MNMLVNNCIIFQMVKILKIFIKRLKRTFKNKIIYKHKKSIFVNQAILKFNDCIIYKL